MSDSIHLLKLPDITKLPLDYSLSEKMDAVRRICNAALFLRKEANIRVRMPLAQLVIYSKENYHLEDFKDIISSEINVKNIVFKLDFETIATEKLVLNLKKAGQKFGNKVPEFVKAVNSGNWTRNGNDIIVLEEILPEDFYEIKLDMKVKNAKVCSCGNIAVLLDTNLTPELENEGIARDIIRMIQQSRKEMDLNVSDRINLQVLSGNDKVLNILNTSYLVEYISNETLAKNIKIVHEVIGNAFTHQNEELGDIKILIERI